MRESSGKSFDAGYMRPILTSETVWNYRGDEAAEQQGVRYPSRKLADCIRDNLHAAICAPSSLRRPFLHRGSCTSASSAHIV